MIVKSKAPWQAAFIVAFVLGSILLGVLAVFFSRHSFKVGSFEHFVITDARENGYSEAELSGDAPFHLNFRLRSGAPSPYAGVSFRMQSAEQALKNEFFDFSSYDSLRIKLSSGRMPRMTLRMATFDSRVTRPELLYTARPVERIVESAGATREVRVALSEFKVSERWFSQMGFDSPDQYTFLDHGMRFEVLTAHGAMLGIPDELEFDEVEFYGTNHALLRALLVAFAIFALLLVSSMFVVARKFITTLDVEHAKAVADLQNQKGLSPTEMAVRAGFKNLSECKRIYREFYKKDFGKS